MARPGLTRHRKFLRLVRSLTAHAGAVGAAVAARGVLETLQDIVDESGCFLGLAEDIEYFVEWRGQPGELVRMLLGVKDGCSFGFLRPVPGGYAWVQPKRRADLSTAGWRKLRKEIIEEQGAVCAHCGAECGDDPTVDHLVPVAVGIHPLTKSNLVVACRPCNSRKGAGLVH